MSRQILSGVSTQQFSESEMRRYFSKGLTDAIVITIVGIVLIIVGSGIPGLAPVVFLGLGLGAIGIVITAYKLFASKPSDQEYDKWLENHANALVFGAGDKLGMQRNQVEAHIIKQTLLSIHGFVLPGMSEAYKYRIDELRAKKGKDGVWRFSVNVYTYFFPEEHHLGAFVGDVNALNQSAHNDKTEEYFYQDVVGATVSDEQNTIEFRGKKYQYRIQQFSLRITNGDSIGATVNARPADNRQNAPIFSIPDSGIDRTIAYLRMLLRTKKHNNP